jgi:uncharacterized membrane protein (UPF0127 family)
MLKPETKLWLGDGVFKTDVALTYEARTKGLSGRSALNSDQALMMAFPSEDKWGIWMKDMNFPIDIVWLNKDKKVIYIVKNAATDDPTVYKPEKLAQYVVELPAGTVTEKNISPKSTAIFELDGEAK